MDASDAREAMVDVARVEALFGNCHLCRRCLPQLIIGRVWIGHCRCPIPGPGVHEFLQANSGKAVSARHFARLVSPPWG